MSRLRLPARCLAFTPAGPLRIEDVVLGDRLVCLTGSGVLETVDVVGRVEDGESEVCVRVLTEAGDALVAQGQTLLTSSGPVAIEKVLGSSGVSSNWKVERLLPEHVLATTTFRSSDCEPGTREFASIQAVGRPWVRLPVRPSELDVTQVHEILSILPQVKYHQTERWHVWTWALVELANMRAPLWTSASLDMLMALSAWDAAHSRAVMADDGLREHLVLSALQEDRHLKFSWTPAYAPVECRVEVLTSRDPYARIAGTCWERTRVIQLELARAAAVYCAPLSVGKLS